MTETRKAQLDAVAEHFGFEPRGIYLLAGAIPEVIEYVPKSGELKSLPRGRRGSVAGTKKPKGRAPSAQKPFEDDDVNLDWIDAL